MSVTHGDGSFDSGHNHLKPALIAVLISVVAIVLIVAFGGAPH